MLQDKKICLDSVDNDTIAYNYDDKTIANATKSTFAETDHSRVKQYPSHICSSHPKFLHPFSIFLDGSRHTFKIDDIGIGKRYFQSLQDKLLLGVASEKIAIPLNAGN